MILKDFIKLLKEFPEDKPVHIGIKGYWSSEDIMMVTLKDDQIHILTKPEILEEIPEIVENSNKIKYNLYDTFSLYSLNNGDILEYNNEQYNIIFKNIFKGEQSFDEYEEYYDKELSYVGGLKKFLQAFPDNMKVNIKVGDYHTGIIHNIEKKNISYLIGTYDNVDEEYYDELFLQYGIPISGYEGGGSVPLTDNTPDIWSDEVSKVIAEPIINYFKENNISLTIKENKEWGGIVEEIKNKLFQNYHLEYRLNGSWDSNGYFHPYNEKELFKKPDTIEEERKIE